MIDCIRCGDTMIWGSDFDFEDYGIEGDGIVAEYSCFCGVSITVYVPEEIKNESGE